MNPPYRTLAICVAALAPLAPGFKRVEIRPQLADLESLDLTAHTAQGPIRFPSQGRLGARRLSRRLPPGCEGELVLPADESVTLPKVRATMAGLAR